MTQWAQVILAALALAREVVKYLNEIEASKKERALKLRELKDGVKKARLEKDTSTIEKAIADIGLSSNPVVRDS